MSLLTTTGVMANRTTTAADDGSYQFANLREGDSYYVQFTPPPQRFFTPANGGDDTLDSDADTATGRTPSISLPAGQSQSSVDAGLLIAASIGGTVWNDVNQNGQFDAGDTPRAGVTANLSNESTPIGTTVTDQDGNYRFDNLRPGTGYQVGFVLPAGTAYTARDVGADDNIDCDVDPFSRLTGSIVPGSGQVDLTRDAGLIPEAMISGTIYFDANGNGLREFGEFTLAGWDIFTDNDQNGVYSAGDASLAQSQSNGTYSLRQLPPGTHQVRLVPQAYWAQATPAAALVRTLTIGQSVTGVDIAMSSTTSAILRATQVETEFRVNSTVAGSQDNVRLAADAAGNFVAVWDDPTGIHGRRFGAGGAPIGDSFQISTTGVTPAIAMDTAGNFTVAWVNGLNIFARRYSALAAPLDSAFQVNGATHTQSTTRTVDIGIDVDGDLVIVWNDGRAMAQRVDRDGAKVGSEFRLDATTTEKTRVSVAVKPAGDFIALFTAKQPNQNTSVFGRRFDGSTNALAGEFVVPDPFETNDSYDHGDVATNASGEFAVVYQTPFRVYMRRFNPDGTPRGVTQQIPNANGTRAAVVLDNIGNITVTWQDPNTSYEINWRRFTGGGLPLSGVFQVAHNLTHSRTRPHLAITPTGFVLAWSSFSQDSSGYGIYAQRYVNIDQPATVGNRVFVDQNNNGLQDAGEASRSGVEISLINQWGAIVATRSTNGGLYVFDMLQPGAPYTIKVIPPANFAFSPANVGNDDAIDSDADLATGVIGPFTYAALANDSSVDIGLVPPPRVAGVYVNSSRWTTAFRQSLQTLGVGTAAHGWRIPGGSTQLAAIPFSGIDRITIVFNADVDVSQSALTLDGVALDYLSSAIHYDPATRAATWDLTYPILATDRVVLTLLADAARSQHSLLHLDGEWQDGVTTASSGNGVAGGNFRFSFNTLSADADRSGAVGHDDFLRLHQNFGQAVTAANIFADFNGSGVIDFGDFQILETAFGRALPMPAPSQPVPARAATKPIPAPIRKPALPPRQASFSRSRINTAYLRA